MLIFVRVIDDDHSSDKRNHNSRRSPTEVGWQVNVQRPIAVVAVVTAALAAAAGGAPPRDHAAVAWNILPPGQAGGVAFTKNSTDQAKLYDALTPLQDHVTEATIAKTFKRETLGLGAERAVSTERPRKGVTITRDSWGVPHIVGTTDVDVAFGAGWATAQDRQLIMELLRGPGRIAALDAPGVNAFSLALAGKTFVPSPATEARLNDQIDLVLRSGDKGRRLVKIIDGYTAGINGAYAKAGLPIRPWTRADVVAIGGLIGGLFGAGGGDETARADLLAKLQAKLGAELGRQVWEDLRLRDDPEARTAVEGSFPYGRSTSELGNVVIDAGSFVPQGGVPSDELGGGAATDDDVERATRRCEAVCNREADRRHGAAGGVLLPRDLAGARSQGRRVQRPRRRVPRNLVRSAARARA